VPITKRVTITLSASLLEEIDGIVCTEKCTRSECIQAAMQLYLADRRRRCFQEEMKQGYIEMAKFNLRLALEDMALDYDLLPWREPAAVE